MALDQKIIMMQKIKEITILVQYGNKSGAGTGAIRVYKNGDITTESGYNATIDKGNFTYNGKYELDKSLYSQKLSNDNYQSVQNTTNKTTSTDDISNITNKNNISLNESKSNSKSLSETGKQSNSGLISISLLYYLQLVH